MFSQDDESTGVALGVVAGVIALVVSLVIGTAIFQKNKTAKLAKANAVAAAPAAPAPVAAAADAEQQMIVEAILQQLAWKLRQLQQIEATA